MKCARRGCWRIKLLTPRFSWLIRHDGKGRMRYFCSTKCWYKYKKENKVKD